MKITIDFSKPLKVVINECYGGFVLSKEALLWLYEKDPNFLKISTSAKYIETVKSFGGALHNSTLTPNEDAVISFEDHNKLLRCHPLLVECVETLGEKASGPCSELTIVEIGPGRMYEIDEHDGYERIKS